MTYFLKYYRDFHHSLSVWNTNSFINAIVHEKEQKALAGPGNIRRDCRAVPIVSLDDRGAYGLGLECDLAGAHWRDGDHIFDVHRLGLCAWPFNPQIHDS